MHIEYLDLPVQMQGILEKRGITKVEQLLKMTDDAIVALDEDKESMKLVVDRIAHLRDKPEDYFENMRKELEELSKPRPVILQERINALKVIAEQDIDFATYDTLSDELIGYHREFEHYTKAYKQYYSEKNDEFNKTMIELLNEIIIILEGITYEYRHKIGIN